MFYNKMDLSVRMRIVYNVKHRYAIRLKFGEGFLTFLTKMCSKGKPVSALNERKSTFKLS